MASTVSSSECDGLFRGRDARPGQGGVGEKPQTCSEDQPVPLARPGGVLPTYRVVFQVIFFFTNCFQ